MGRLVASRSSADLSSGGCGPEPEAKHPERLARQFRARRNIDGSEERDRRSDVLGFWIGDTCPTSGLSTLNWRFIPASHRPAD